MDEKERERIETSVSFDSFVKSSELLEKCIVTKSQKVI